MKQKMSVDKNGRVSNIPLKLKIKFVWIDVKYFFLKWINRGMLLELDVWAGVLRWFMPANKRRYYRDKVKNRKSPAARSRAIPGIRK